MTGLIGFASGTRPWKPAHALLMLHRFPLSAVLPEGMPASPKSTIRARGDRSSGSCRAWSGRPGWRTLRALRRRLVAKRDRSYLDAHEKLRRARKGLGRSRDRAIRGAAASAADCPRAERTRQRRRHFTCDVGLPTVWRRRYLTMNGRVVWSARSGTLNGECDGAGHRAQAAFPQRQ